MLEVDGLSSGYGEAVILEDLDFEVGDGEFLSIVGPNGAGKSTLLKTIAGVVDTFDGEIRYKGESLAGVETNELLERGFVYIPQDGSIFNGLTVAENLRMNAWGVDDEFDERVEAVYEQFPVLEERRDQIAGSMSGGQRRMLAVSPAIIYDPDLLILDEPSSGLAPQLVEEVFEHIENIITEGTSVILVEQNARRALEIADRALVMEGGRIRHSGDADELLESGEITDLFMGGEG